jgi:outer membrane protein OmpA-like peptidoglycan-associated protein
MRSLFLTLLLSVFGSALYALEPSVDTTWQQLMQSLDNLDQVAKQDNVAALERLQARQSAVHIQSVRVRDRPAALEDAQILFATAQYAVQYAQLKDQLVQLQREHDAILVEAARRDAVLARQETERLRMQVLAREEEQSMLPLVAPANNVTDTTISAIGLAADEPTRRLAEAKVKGVELARLEEELYTQMTTSADDVLKILTNNGKTRYVLSSTAFEPGKSNLTALAKQVLRELSKKLQSTGRAWLIEGHSDATGDEAANIQFSKKRADAVSSVLKSAGVPIGKLHVIGLGSSQPIASNQTKSGRAQNRRIEIIQK